MVSSSKTKSIVKSLDLGHRILFKTDEGEMIKLSKSRIVIGSVASADIRIHGEAVAPIHAIIEIHSGASKREKLATIFDLASESGVFVNQKKIQTASLHQGDEFKVGGRNFQVFHPESLDEVEPLVDPDFIPLSVDHSRVLESGFTYSQKPPVLQVVMAWCGVVLDVKHFPQKKRIVLSDQKNADFIIPHLLSKNEAVLAEVEGTTSTVYKDEKWEGVVQKKGSLKNIRELGSVFNLEEEEFAKLSIGDLDFFLSYSEAPPLLQRDLRLDKDPFFFRILSASMALSLAFMLSLGLRDIPEQIQVEEIPDRVATIIYKPEYYKFRAALPPAQKSEEEKKETPPPVKPEPKKKVVVDIKNLDKADPTKKTIQTKTVQTQPKRRAGAKTTGSGESKEGAGALAKGESGSRGNPNSKNTSTSNQSKLERPNPNSRPGKTGVQGVGQTQDAGNISALKGANQTLDNLLGNLSGKVGTRGGKRIEGIGAFDSKGAGGLALQGDGAGGGGASDLLGGLSNEGTGRGRVGTGLGAAGKGSGILGGKSRVVLNRNGPEETVVMGSIDTSGIEAALLAAKDRFRYCYEREVNLGKPKIAGRVQTAFTIEASGRVSKAGVLSSTLQDRNTEKCILDVIKTIDFPKPDGGAVVEVRFPFKFSVSQ